jgi:dimethylaniline monooxygenase (N-oxide forming)
MRRALLFGPLAPSCFRLEGPDALPDAPVRFERDAAAFGAITSNELTERERSYWSLVETAASGPTGSDGGIAATR